MVERTRLAILARYRSQAYWAPAFLETGVARFWLRLQGIRYQGTRLVLQSKYVKARASELESIRISAEQARGAGHIASKPLIVLVSGKADPVLLNPLEDFQLIWVDQLQPRLARLSTKGKLILLPDSGPDVPNKRPDAIIAAVRELAGYSTPNASSTLPQAPVNRP